MQYAARMRQASMDAAVNAPRRLVGRIGPLHGLLVVGIEEEEIRSLDPREMPPTRIHEEALAVGRDRQAEMIGDRLVPVERLGKSEGGGEIDARLPLGRFGLELGDGHVGSS